MLTQSPARDTAAPQPQLPQALAAVLDAPARAADKERRRREHQDHEDGAFTGGRPDTRASIAAFVADQTATIYVGMMVVDGELDTIFLPRRPDKRKWEGRTKIPQQCLLTDLHKAARQAERKTRRATSRKITPQRRALHQ